MSFFDWIRGLKAGGSGSASSDSSVASGSVAPDPSDPSPVRVDVALDEHDETLVGAVADFGISLGRKREDNLVCSSFSLFEAWLRVWAGAVGECQSEIERAFGLREPAALASKWSELNRCVQQANGPDCEVHTANKLFVRPGLPLCDEFDSEWGGATQEVDFSDRAAAAKFVNDWVADRTNQMIPEVVDEDKISPATVMMIANAIYLNAKWADPFKPISTSDERFELSDGSAVNVATMVQMLPMRCAATDDFEIVIKPYAGGRLAMVVLLPRPGRFAAVRDSLRWGAVDTAIRSATVILTSLWLPRFSIASDPEVDGLIRARGAELVYAPETADLSAMSPDARNPGQELFVGSTTHKARIDVDEEGTKAAAATVVDMLAGSAMPKAYTFKVDRPFLYFVIEQATRLPLFTGQVVAPGS